MARKFTIDPQKKRGAVRRITVRLTDLQARELEKAAKREGIPVGELVRRRALGRKAAA
jgi:hypothetical protein